MSASRRIVAKIGSQALCDENGALDGAVIDALAAQVATLHDRGWQVLLVSSGAVAAGLGVAADATATLRDPVAAKQVLAAAGQVRLMERWQQAFRGFGLTTAQILLSKSDFQSRQHYLNTRSCLEGALAAGLVPVVNENDVVAVTELMFTDNDELAGLLATMVNADVLALLSTVPGVLQPEDGKPIDTWDDERHTIDAVVRSGTSRLGRGGMHSKLAVARKTAGLGTTVIIADGRATDVLPQIVSDTPMGTRFPASAPATPARRWLSGMAGHALGVVIVNDGARDALLDQHRLTSLLPVGVERVVGEFQRGDVIEVRDMNERLLGCGRAGYDAEEARAALGQRDRKPLIHYDYLYLVDD